MICPGGAFMFRSMKPEGYDIADMLVRMGYQCFIVNYRISPYTMLESATDLQRAIRYVKANSDAYRINPENIALVGFSAGGSPSIWGNDFYDFLTPIMAKTSSGVQTISMRQETEKDDIYDLYGNSVKNIDSRHGVFIVRNNQGTKKILK